MPRAVKPWIGRTDDSKAPPRVRIRPLLGKELGRGVHLSESRIGEIRAEIMRLIGEGYTQREIGDALNATNSRISRWTRRSVMETGAPLRLIQHRDRTLPQMMWDRIEVMGSDECWRWLGGIKPNGYGALNFKGKGYNAHRLVFETLVGPIPDGMVVDHICCNPSCVNPKHLQVVYQSENLMLAARRRA